MDPTVITGIMTAIMLGVAAGTKDTAAQVVKDAYQALKKRLNDHFKIGLDDLELDQSETEQKAVAERIAKRNAGQDTEVIRLSRDLTEIVRRDPKSRDIVILVDRSEDVLNRIGKEASASITVTNSKRIQNEIQ